MKAVERSPGEYHFILMDRYIPYLGSRLYFCSDKSFKGHIQILKVMDPELVRGTLVAFQTYKFCKQMIIRIVYVTFSGYLLPIKQFLSSVHLPYSHLVVIHSNKQLINIFAVLMLTMLQQGIRECCTKSIIYASIHYHDIFNTA